MSRRVLTFEEVLRDLKRLLLALEPYLGAVVLAGGWTPWFHRLLPRLLRPAHPALFTYDFDVVVPTVLPPDPAGTMHQRLSDAEFVPLVAIDPPVVIYQHESWGRSEKAPVYTEMLTPLRGSILDRAGQPKHVKRVQEGLTAQQLRYLDLLLHEPLDVDVGRAEELDMGRSLTVRLPNPATYILQKALIRSERKAEARRKDLAYIYDLAVIWFRRAERVREMMESVAAESPEWAMWLAKGCAELQYLFRDPDADGPVSVESEFAVRPEGPPVTAEAAFRIVRTFLDAVLL